jgi:hypothetical protein
MKQIPLEFEQPLAVLAQQIEAIKKQLASNPELDKDVERLQEQYNNLEKSKYAN